MTKNIKKLAWFFLIVGGIIIVYFLIKSIIDGFHIGFNQKTNYEVTGQFGDFIGGVVGTFFALTGTLLIYLTFKEQTKENLKNKFESSFFEMIRLHRDNISELSYRKIGKQEVLYENRQVFRTIFSEFIECYSEVKKYTRSHKVEELFNPKYLEKVKTIKSENSSNFSLKEMAIIDISYSMVFYGVGIEGETILRNNFSKRYKSEFYFRLLYFIKMKPKRSNEKFKNWQFVRNLEAKKLHELINELYANRKGKKSAGELSTFDARRLSHGHKNFVKYYGGHQFRLGHYFRHLFQSFKYLDSSHFNTNEKYSYGKMLRAQLSTYEQALLFINSISTLGMKWEYIPEEKDGKRYKINLISNFNLIKNLPGRHLFGINYKDYYKNVDYESDQSLQ